ncbi:hypothetical protein [Demequina sp.]|uniref:hypothetical protein n=1 Tax=Demequina sp. TaxID=2050685 RepID=UPI0025C23F02|nr:hypothetical protein [Demequina sp.]
MDREDIDTWVDSVVHAIGAPTIADWIAAAAGAITAVIAIGAAVFAWRQVQEVRSARKQARELDTKRSQPYVVVSAEPSAVTPLIIDLVVKNYGLTAAYGVTFQIDPWPSRTGNAGAAAEDVQLPHEIAVLAPGQEWRTFWDHSPDRKDAGLPDRHVGTVNYLGINDEPISQPVVLDWSVFKSRIWTERRGMHDAATALREMNTTMKKWSESAEGALAVYTRDGVARDERVATQHAELLARLKKRAESHEE